MPYAYARACIAEKVRYWALHAREIDAGRSRKTESWRTCCGDDRASDGISLTSASVLLTSIALMYSSSPVPCRRFLLLRGREWSWLRNCRCLWLSVAPNSTSSFTADSVRSVMVWRDVVGGTSDGDDDDDGENWCWKQPIDCPQPSKTRNSAGVSKGPPGDKSAQARGLRRTSAPASSIDATGAP